MEQQRVGGPFKYHVGTREAWRTPVSQALLAEAVRNSFLLDPSIWPMTVYDVHRVLDLVTLPSAGAVAVLCTGFL